MTRKPLVIATMVAGLATASISMNASADPVLGAILGGGMAPSSDTTRAATTARQSAP